MLFLAPEWLVQRLLVIAVLAFVTASHQWLWLALLLGGVPFWLTLKIRLVVRQKRRAASSRR